MTVDRYDPDDRDAPLASDLDQDDDQDDDETVACPHCGHPLYIDAAKCPACLMWVDDISDAGRRARGWRWPILIALLVAVILVFWHGLGR